MSTAAREAARAALVPSPAGTGLSGACSSGPAPEFKSWGGWGGGEGGNALDGAEGNSTPFTRLGGSHLCPCRRGLGPLALAFSPGSSNLFALVVGLPLPGCYPLHTLVLAKRAGPL